MFIAMHLVLADDIPPSLGLLAALLHNNLVTPTVIEHLAEDAASSIFISCRWHCLEITTYGKISCARQEVWFVMTVV